MKVVYNFIILFLVVISSVFSVSYAENTYWPDGTQYLDYGSVKTFSLYEVSDIGSDDVLNVYDHINRWLPDSDSEIFNGYLMLRFDVPYRGEYFYTLKHDANNRIVMNGLDLGVSYDLLTELNYFDRPIFVTYTPDYLRESWDLSSITELRSAESEFDVREFLDFSIPKSHPLAIWDVAYGNSTRNTDFAPELPFIVGMGVLYGLSENNIKLLIAIRVHENGQTGNEFGVKKAVGTNLLEQAHYASGTVRNKYYDYLRLANPNTDFIAYLGAIYAPTTYGLPEEERKGNENWIPGVRRIYQYLEPYSLSNLLSYLD
ncbi:MAG: hypothetical protein P9L98_06765 [Candidatus Kaelpia imicola]|nr:hypothetical protein [Candidatus Kaelpia imicola]